MAEMEVPQHRTVITNCHGEKLVGMLHETGSKGLVILCHGFRSSKDENSLLNLAEVLTRDGISTFRFDFAGNGESEGSFHYGNYRKEADDLRAVVQHFSGKQREIIAIAGHSKGGNVVLLYASVYHDVNIVINISGRYALDKGIDGRLGKDFMQRVKEAGFIDVKDKTGQVEYRVTVESLMDRLSTDMHAACLSIDKDCRVMTIHGSLDEIIPVEDALEFAKLIPNHKLHIIDGANHSYTKHQAELASVVLDFLRSNQVGGANA
uniref:Serine aminopeptidase S33 domain-containing protein n=1 Tax=Anthurium amnicola TaxID=1678845 RepID=A0A1D1XMD2_9ARAE